MDIQPCNFIATSHRDKLDLDILVCLKIDCTTQYQTAHIVYSWNDNKPTVTTSNSIESYSLTSVKNISKNVK